MSSQKVTNIKSLRELRLEKERLTRESGLAKQAFGRSLIKSQKVTSSYLLKTVVAPVGAVGVAILVANRFFKSDSASDTPAKEPNSVVSAPKNAAPTPIGPLANTPPPPAPKPLTPRQRPEPSQKRGSSKEGINWSALFNAGKFLVPLVQIVIGIANQEISKGEQKGE
ncbi:hypothetical protein [Lewinella sp. W8]|uniref:hypothetical protein n=1 Tax=Lewinella sp. W8 TaxID=2528208 RepID=UPI0010686D25|nr:hypothetical protein [Lewinella sp. W8]MTB51647.1 hypothetical protein [Lewinella sp. W8]